MYHFVESTKATPKNIREISFCIWHISLSPFAPENLVSRDGYGHPVSRQPAYSPYSGWTWCLLTGFLPISAAASIHLFKPPYAIGSVLSLSGHAIAYRWCSLPRVRRHKANGSQRSSSNGGCRLGRSHHGPIYVRLSFTTPTIGMKWACYKYRRQHVGRQKTFQCNRKC